MLCQLPAPGCPAPSPRLPALADKDRTSWWAVAIVVRGALVATVILALVVAALLLKASFPPLVAAGASAPGSVAHVPLVVSPAARLLPDQQQPASRPPGVSSRWAGRRAAQAAPRRGAAWHGRGQMRAAAVCAGQRTCGRSCDGWRLAGFSLAPAASVGYSSGLRLRSRGKLLTALLKGPDSRDGGCQPAGRAGGAAAWVGGAPLPDAQVEPAVSADRCSAGADGVGSSGFCQPPPVEGTSCVEGSLPECSCSRRQQRQRAQPGG